MKQRHQNWSKFAANIQNSTCESLFFPELKSTKASLKASFERKGKNIHQQSTDARNMYKTETYVAPLFQIYDSNIVQSFILLLFNIVRKAASICYFTKDIPHFMTTVRNETMLQNTFQYLYSFENQAEDARLYFKLQISQELRDCPAFPASF